MALRHCTNIIMLLVVGRAFANLQQNFDSVLPIMGCIDWPPSQDSQGSRRARCKMTRFDLGSGNSRPAPALITRPVAAGVRFGLS